MHKETNGSKSLIVATTNPHKVEEIRAMIGSAVPNVRGTADRTDLKEVEETGETFRENAEKKAREYYEQLEQPTLADDSGLCVEALNGRPGVRSARFAGSNATDEENNQKLLKQLESVPLDQRQARFECCITLYVSQKLIITTIGTCFGRIRKEPRGTAGFGYDPLFEPEGCSRTFGEMSAEEKDQLSHRSDAIRQLNHLIQSNRGDLWASETDEMNETTGPIQ